MPLRSQRDGRQANARSVFPQQAPQDAYNPSLVIDMDDATTHPIDAPRSTIASNDLHWHKGADQFKTSNTRPPQPRQESSSLSCWTRVVREVGSWQRGTVSIHDVDAWLQFNLYIRRGFRHRMLRKREALGSLFLYLHNETFNIVSHLVAALLMLSLLWWPLHVSMGSSGGAQDLYQGGGGDGAGSDTEFASSLSSVQDRWWVASSQRDGMRGQKDARPPSAPPSPQQAPSWLLRSLHGLETHAVSPQSPTEKDSKSGGNKFDAEGAGGRGEVREGHAYVPQGGAASPRDGPLATSGHSSRLSTPSTSSSASSLSPSSWFTFASLLFSPNSYSTSDADAQAPITVAARLAFSLKPLTWCLLFTFVLSCIYHTFMPCCRSRRGYQQLLQCDVMGVLLSIGGSAYTYLTCGMPCASETAVLWATCLVTLSTLLCLYLVVLAPMWDVLIEGCSWASTTGQWAVAWVLCAAMERVTGLPLPSRPPTAPTPPVTSDVADRVENHHSTRQRRTADGQRRDRRSSNAGSSSRTPPVTLSVVLRWLQQHRHWPLCHSTRKCGAEPTAASSRPCEPVHITVHQRAAIVGVYCLLHLGIYRWFVYPKSNSAHGGFTQGVHYHNISYFWLFMGGIVNAARFPERLVFNWTRQAAKHTRDLAAQDAAAWCAEELAAADTSGPSPSPSSSPTWWRRFSVAKWMVTYVVSASTLDYVGNSHNIWHVCTMLSAFANVLAVYYDCMEYDLVVCG